MPPMPVMLDLFCGAGGCIKGYQTAGFYVVGVDCQPQSRCCANRFVQMEALTALFVLLDGGEIAGFKLAEFDAIHVSPPCQGYSVTKSMPWTRGGQGRAPTLIRPTRDLLVSIGKPFVIENVVGAPLVSPIMLCGTMFGLKLFRHRLFESNVFLMQPPHGSHRGLAVGRGGFVCMAGHGDAGRGRIPADHRTVRAWQIASGIEWMTRAEMTQAIPPAYTMFIGKQLIHLIRGRMSHMGLMGHMRRTD